MPDGPSSDDLATLRAAIDAVDDQILALLDRRAEVVREVGRHKRERREAFHVPAARARGAGAPDRAPPTAPSRARRCAPCSARSCRPACRWRARWWCRTPGPRRRSATWPARPASGFRRCIVPAASLGEVFREVGRGADYGVVPVEEASEGLVTHALDHFLDSDLLIVGEIVIEAAHALLTHTGTDVRHRAGLRAPGGGGALRGRAGRGGGGRGGRGGALGGRRPRRWRATICARRRWRRRWRPSCSTSRWPSPASTTGRPTSRASWCWGGTRRRPTGDDATSLLVGLDDKPGRLAEVLNRLGAAGLNLRRIASRPTDRRGLRDLFFVDVDGHRDDAGLPAALDGAGRGSAAVEGARVRIRGTSRGRQP